MEFERGQLGTRRLLQRIGIGLAVLALIGLVRGQGVAAGLLPVGLLLVYGARGAGPERIVVRPDELELHGRRGQVRRFARASVRRAEVDVARLVIETADGEVVREPLGYHRVDDLRDELARWEGGGEALPEERGTDVDG